MTLRWQLKTVINSYYKTIRFMGEKPKWELLIEIGELSLSDSILDIKTEMDETKREDIIERKNRLNEILARLKKNIVNPKSEDVAFVLRVADDILTRKHEEIPEGTIAMGEDII